MSDARSMPGAKDGVAIPGVLCMQCGYDVRGLAVEAACPECAASVSGSVMVYQPPSPPRESLPTMLRMLCAIYVPVAIGLNVFAGVIGSVLGSEQVEDLRRYSTLTTRVEVAKLVMFVVGMLLLVGLIRRGHWLMWPIMFLELFSFFDLLIPQLGRA